jgi:hypothetical protein
MKTVKFILAALVLSFSIISCQKETIEPQQSFSGSQDLNANPIKKGEINNESKMDITIRVQYSVAVHLPIGRALVNTYQVEIVNANEEPVAPRQIFVPGTSVYNFFEQTQQESGIRIARLVPLTYPNEHFISKPELFTSPVIIVANFVDVQSYSFDLYPKFLSSDPNLSASTITE